MRLLLSTLLFASMAFAQEGLSLRNDREGKSVYATDLNAFTMKRFLKKITREEVLGIFHTALQEQKDKKLCAYDLNKSIQDNLEAKGHLDVSLKPFLHVVREGNEIDDVVAGILLKAHEVRSTLPPVKEEEQIATLENTESTEELLKLVASFEKRFLKNSCLDEAYKSFYGELTKLDKRLDSVKLEALLRRAKSDQRIDADTYLMLEQGRLNDLELGGLTLAAYQQKITMLRTQYPLRDRNEKSNWVSSEKLKKIKLSRRQKLYQSYSDLQIIMMANVIKTLRSDLESPKIEIVVTGKEPSGNRTVELQPMERFRFALKAMRKEMALLSLNTYFAGRTPEYLDLMVAAYEIGLIPASEVEEIAKLEEIWNPKKTFWDKASKWVSTFGSIATLVIPPPYGFIPALAVVVIQATTQGKKNNQGQEDPTSLF